MTKKEIAAYIDQTLLSPTATEEELVSFVTKAKDFGFASVCINPVYIKKAKEILAGCETKVCTVIDPGRLPAEPLHLPLVLLPLPGGLPGLGDRRRCRRT